MINDPHMRYTADIELGSPNDPHVLAVGRVPARSNVLDLGAADGSVAEVLRMMDCHVWGVEYDDVAASVARNVCEDVLVADLNELDLAQEFSGKRFDVVLMLDVLEHLVDPVKVLEGVKGILQPSGWAVISLPNISHISVRLALLNGRFEYTETGLLDKTHLRFFDRRAVDDLLSNSGWRAFEVVRVTRELGTTEIPFEWGASDQVRGLLAELETDEDALTYQFVVCAAPEGSAVLAEPPFLPAAVAQRTLLELQAWTRIPGLWNQLDEMRKASLIRRNHLKYLVSNLRENSERIAQTLAELG